MYNKVIHFRSNKGYTIERHTSSSLLIALLLLPFGALVNWARLWIATKKDSRDS